MKTILYHIFTFILFCFILASIMSCGGDTSTEPDTNAFSEGNTININIDNSDRSTTDKIIEPKCLVCEDDLKANTVYEQIQLLANMFLEKLLSENETTDKSFTITIINDLVTSSTARLNKGDDTQSIITDFENNLNNLGKELNSI